MTEQQREVLKRAIKMLREEALGIQQGHTLSGNWDGEEEAKSAHDEMLAVASQLDALSHAEGEAVEIEAPEFHAEGMGCGLEDRGITDRYEAMEYGFNEAVEQYEVIIEGYGQLYTHPAPQVAVPEAAKERVVEAIAEALGDAMDCTRVWGAWGVGTMGPGDFVEIAGDADRLDEIAEAAIGAMLAAAPTAPAGEPAEIPEIGSQWRHRNGNVYTVESITNGETERPGQYPVTVVYRGENEKLWSRPAHDWHRSMTFESAPEQPVSDPDGLTEPGRREAEQAYINCAFDYARDPIGSRDWVLFWNGWRARNAAPAPDERKLLERLYGTLERATPPADESPEDAVADAMAPLSDFLKRADKHGGAE